MTETYSDVLAAVGDTTGLANWLQSNVVSLVLIIVAIVVMSRAGNKDHKGALVTTAIVLIGLAVLGLAATGGAANVSTWLANLLFGA